MLNENSFILGLEIFKKYYYPEIVINEKQSQFINEIDKLAKTLGHKGAGITLANKIYLLAQTVSPRPNNRSAHLSAISCADSLILTIKTTTTIISEMDKIVRGYLNMTL